jgi:hypothetical protein
MLTADVTLIQLLVHSFDSVHSEDHDLALTKNDVFRVQLPQM